MKMLQTMLNTCKRKWMQYKYLLLQFLMHNDLNGTWKWLTDHSSHISFKFVTFHEQRVMDTSNTKQRNWGKGKNCSTVQLCPSGILHVIIIKDWNQASMLRVYHRHGLATCPIVFKIEIFIIILTIDKSVYMCHFVSNHQIRLYEHITESDFNYILSCSNLNGHGWLT
jgi:hypothetical protein